MYEQKFVVYMGQAGKAGKAAHQASTRLPFPEGAVSGELAWAKEESEESEEEHKASWGVGGGCLETDADSHCESSTSRGRGGRGLLLGRRIEVLDKTAGQPQWFRGTVISLDLSSVSFPPLRLCPSVHAAHCHEEQGASSCAVVLLSPKPRYQAPWRSPPLSSPCAPRRSVSLSVSASARTVV